MEKIFVDLLIFLLGLFAGNRLALGREKRKEFNEAIQQVRPYFFSQKNNPSCYGPRPSSESIDLLYGLLPWYKRSREPLQNPDAWVVA
jgi:hypothetical protein